MLHFTGWVILPQEHSDVKDDDILFSDSVFTFSPHRRHNFQTGTINIMTIILYTVTHVISFRSLCQ